MRPKTSEADLDSVVAAVLAGDRRAVSRALSEVENAPDGALAGRLYLHSGRAHVVGVTGAPGSGKSTLVSALVRELRSREKRVGVVAVDPSSPFSGGAVLGDRVRMGAHSGDPGVFIRSMASRGSVGGLAAATAQVVRVLDAAGFDIVLVETVGAGQAEVEIADEAHTTIVVVVPGLGDDIQAIKAGILEIADIYCVNKADLQGADRTVAHLKMMLSLDTREGEGRWVPPVLRAIATTGEGVDVIADKIEAHRSYLEATGSWSDRERERAGAELRRRLYNRLVEGTLAQMDVDALDRLLERLARRELDPEGAVDELAQTAMTP